MKSKLNLLIVLLSIYPSFQYNLDCSFKTFGFLTNINYCKVNGDFHIYEPNTVIDIPKSFQPQGFVAEYKQVYFIPIGIEKSMQKLKVLVITNSKLRKVLKEDLKNYKDLEYLDLSGNEIETLGKQIFQNNPNLNEIMLNNNKIYGIDPTAFEGLKKLSILELNNNICCNESADKSNMKQFIDSLKSSCLMNMSYDKYLISLVQKNSYNIEEIRTEISKQKRQIDENISNLSTNIHLVSNNVLISIKNIESKMDIQTSYFHDANEASKTSLTLLDSRFNDVSKKLQNLEDEVIRCENKLNMNIVEIKSFKSEVNNLQNKINKRLDDLKIKLDNVEAKKALAPQFIIIQNKTFSLESQINTKSTELFIKIQESLNNLTKLMIKSIHQNLKDETDYATKDNNQIEELKQSFDEKISLVRCLYVTNFILLLSLFFFIFYMIRNAKQSESHKISISKSVENEQEYEEILNVPMQRASQNIQLYDYPTNLSHGL